MTKLLQISYLILLIGLSYGCSESTPQTGPSEYSKKPNDLNPDSIINAYFDRYDLTPNYKFLCLTPFEQIDSIGEQFEFAKHNIKWKMNGDQFILEIDNKKYNFNDHVTRNNVWGPSKDTPFYVNHLEEVSQYIIDNREILLLKFGYAYCNGLGCGIQYYIVYDSKNKSPNWFGHFRHWSKPHLVSMDSAKIGYVATTFNGRNEFCRDTINYELFTLNDDGIFNAITNSNGQPYKIMYYSSMCDSIKQTYSTKEWFDKF